MKSLLPFARRAVVLAGLSSLLLLSACGQKGPLFRPVIPPDPLAKTAPKPAATAPAKATTSAPDPAQVPAISLPPAEDK